MNDFFRGIIAAWGAKKLGGGCLSTIVIFVIIYTLLGKCGNDQPRHTYNQMPSKTQPVSVCESTALIVQK